MGKVAYSDIIVLEITSNGQLEGSVYTVTGITKNHVLVPYNNFNDVDIQWTTLSGKVSLLYTFPGTEFETSLSEGIYKFMFGIPE